MPDINFGAYALDPTCARLLKHGKTVPLPPKALAVLIYLAERRGRLICKGELLDGVWGHRFVSQGVLKNTVAMLRLALDDDPKNPRYIETVHRQGYRFIAKQAAASSSAHQATAAAPEPVNFPGILPLVGREHLFAELHRSLETAIKGEPQLVFVTGEPGIGKTALIDAFVRSASVRALTCRGQCVEQYEQGEPYLPVLEALNDLVKNDEARLSALVRQVAPTWLAQLPWYQGQTDQPYIQLAGAGATHMRMLREFGEFLARCSEEQPLILVLEDLHWSDHATLDLLAYLARRRQPARWLVVASYRPADVMMADHGLKHVRRELQIQGLCSELALEPLSEAAIGEYFARRFPNRPMPEAWVKELHDRSGGLPFFLVQLIETLQAEQILDGGATEGGLPAVLPPAVKLLMARQFERLPDDCRRVLEAASMVGMTFLVESVATELSMDNVEVEECCENLVRLGQFIDPVTDSKAMAYRFRHAFYQEFICSCLLPTRQARAQLSVGEWTEVVRSRPGKLATEQVARFEQGRDVQRAADYLQPSAGSAIRRPMLEANAIRTNLFGKWPAAMPKRIAKIH